MSTRGLPATCRLEWGVSSVGQCISYAAHGGQFITLNAGQFLLPAGHIATFTSSAIKNPSCGGAFFGVSSLDGAEFSLVAEAPDACDQENLFEERFGPFGSDEVFHFFLNDFSCDPSYSDVDGAVISGSNPYQVSMSGPAGCSDDSASTVMTIN